MRLETTILKNLIYNEEYTRKVLPFLSVNYFQEREDKILYEKINEYINQYNALPTQEALAIELDKSSIKDEEFEVPRDFLFDSMIELIPFISIQEIIMPDMRIKTDRKSIRKNIRN